MEHLYFTKVDKPPQDRRKKKGFVPRGDRKSNIQHGEELLSQVKNQVTENNDDIRRFRFEPHLVMKVELEKDASLAKKDAVEQPPKWCSVDLRDGNQALIEPMSLDEKLEFFQMLVDIGFKEIEVGFPAASETEYQFMRTLIEKDMIPNDVTVQVLTQAREHIIKRTFEAVKGAPHAVIHLYNSTSVAQREQVFRKDKEQVKQLAIDGAKLLLKLADGQAGRRADLRHERPDAKSLIRWDR